MNSINKQDVKVLFAPKYTAFDDINNSKKGSYVKITSLSLRVNRDNEKLVLNLGVTQNTRFIALEKLGSAVKRRYESPHRILTPLMLKQNPGTYEMPVEKSVSDIININLSSFMEANENGKCGYSLARILSVKDKVTFTAIIIEKSMDEQSDRARDERAFFKLRDVKTNDTVNLFILFTRSVGSHVELLNKLQIFTTVKFNSIPRMISKSLSIYCKVSLNYKQSMDIISQHDSSCENLLCPCHNLISQDFCSHNIKYQGNTYGLPYVHRDEFANYSFLSEISVFRIFRNIIKINAIVERVLYFVLEYSCPKCKILTNQINSKYCNSCCDYNVRFNVKALVQIDDCSSVAAEARIETLEDTKRLLQLDDDMLGLLEIELENKNSQKWTLSQREFSDEMKRHFYSLAPKFFDLAVKPHVPNKYEKLNQDNYISYCTEMGRDQTVLLNSDINDQSEIPKTTLKIYKVFN